MSNDEVTQWIRALAKGDESAVQEIWKRYYSELLSPARRKLKNIRKKWAAEAGK